MLTQEVNYKMLNTTRENSNVMYRENICVASSETKKTGSKRNLLPFLSSSVHQKFHLNFDYL